MLRSISHGPINFWHREGGYIFFFGGGGGAVGGGSGTDWGTEQEIKINGQVWHLTEGGGQLRKYSNFSWVWECLWK